MKIAVIGGTGLIGSKMVKILNAAGHEATPHSLSTGVDLLSGQGLPGAGPQHHRSSHPRLMPRRTYAPERRSESDPQQPVTGCTAGGASAYRDHACWSPDAPDCSYIYPGDA
ncbi:MAG: hypothetical protein ACRDNW_13320 [Trebonia sp.]